jgi:hypothetical protein
VYRLPRQQQFNQGGQKFDVLYVQSGVHWARRRSVFSMSVRNLQGQLWLVRGCDKMLLVVVLYLSNVTH